MKILPTFQLRLPFPSFNPQKIEIHEDVKNMMKRPPRHRNSSLGGEPLKYWTSKERFIVGAILGLTILGSLIFWYKGQNGNVDIKLPSFESLNFGETVVIEK